MPKKKIKRDANGKFAGKKEVNKAAPAAVVLPIDDKPVEKYPEADCGISANSMPCDKFVTTGYFPGVNDALYVARSLGNEYKQYGYYAKNIVQQSRFSAQHQEEYCFELTFAKL